MNYAFQPLKKYADFSGRARRKEFWLFMLKYMICCIILCFIDIALKTWSYEYGIGLYSGIFIFALMIPATAVAVRRLHDSNRSGWWYLLVLLPILGPLVLLAFYCLAGTDGPNRFGTDPRLKNPQRVYAT